MDSTIIFAFLLTLFAGLATGIGSMIAFFAKRTNTAFLSISLGFSAGVMIYVSFIEIFPKALVELVGAHGEKAGTIYTVLAFFGGMLLIALIDKLIPSPENPHEVKFVETMQNDPSSQELATTATKDEPAPLNQETKQRLHKMGLFMALAITIHNFPEGLATFISALDDPAVGIAIAIAIALHNIPEGIAVSVPIYYATGSRKKALKLSFLSGLAEPVGAIVGFLILMPFLNDTIFGLLFAAVGGIMVFISLDELLPAAREYGRAHHSIYGMVAGMMVMAASLVLLM
ncbi:zinc transporter ZupT [Exiguobacterium sp. SH3S2]|uniref:zinc transporter ZupT n=1 Tax=unclassified Exiguobacterium TaxID=2644629 RepID=UPI00103F8456|nr:MULTISPECIES: zinc transporter ZupT [unclassified Exiguobacterium]TCI26585.1 zinc transporter ZupT [Exiguobacterium sp. SH5S4]TCI45882.1 zinc transporter ZupT [Exiguobacterium sp. SH5S32]TCI49044.1 zinc transporter ZupT [Exiguobacterium sp. SH3S3]TCI51639.1 zinc transporter ZupT [Exiguobacterium sp. SH1S4]TCI53506.1 zinc transporter ZupT [Exiguobacterium sp. SH5S13]